MTAVVSSMAKSEAMDTAAMHEDLNCGFCLQKLTYMTEPKQLPCSHVFCLPCLQEDPKKDCPVCGRVYDADWTGMKSYECADQHTTNVSTEHIKCDVCKKEIAVCFCTGCEQKLCDEHFKLHEQSKVFFTSAHQQIDISVYAINKSRYDPKYCLTHDKKLTTSCYGCYRTFCSSCDTIKTTCPSASQQSNLGACHDTASVSTIASHMRHDLKMKLKDISDKVTEGLNLEKKVWESLHEAESEVSKLMAEVDQLVDEVIDSVKEKGEMLKEELRTYQRRCTDEVEAFSGQLRDERDRLDNVWKSVTDELRDTHDADVIPEYERKALELKAALPENYEDWPNQPFKVLLTKTMSNISLGLTLMEPDQIDIQFCQQFYSEDGQLHYSAAWLGDDVIVGGNKGFFVYNPSNNKSKEINVSCQFVCSVESFGRFAVAALCKTDGKLEIRLSCLDSLHLEDAIICEYDQDNLYLAHMALSETHVASADKQGKQVRVYNWNGFQLLTLGSGKLKHPCGVLLQKNSVFVSDADVGCLYKYRLEEDSEPEWVCDGLKSPTGICQDKNGYIYVASNSKRAIYLISPQGVLIRTLSCEELSNTQNVHDISLSGDGATLALACRKEGVKLFTIKKH